MSIINALKKQLERDILKQKDIVQKDEKQHFLHFSEERQVFLGVDESGTEWIAGPKTDVPCYWIYCSNIIEYAHKGIMKSKRCNKPHFVSIYSDGDDMTCVECGYQSRIKINLPEDAPQYGILQRVQTEKKG